MVAAYPAIVILLCDIAVIFASIYWFEYGGRRAYNPIRTPAPYLIRIVIYGGLFVALASGIELPDAVIVCSWYVIIITAVCHAFYAILQALNFKDTLWLAGTSGSIGVPNWISITRIALSLIVPHIYVEQPFGDISNIIATAILAIAMLSDAVDGFFARKLKAITKAGKVLDPIGDKVIFYPIVVAFLLASSGTAFQQNEFMSQGFYIFLGFTVFRDVAFAIWFLIYRNKIGEGLGAGIVDKIRMVVICAFLALMALTLTIPSIRTTLANATMATLFAIAVLSLLSIVYDLKRFREYMANR